MLCQDYHSTTTLLVIVSVITVESQWLYCYMYMLCLYSLQELYQEFSSWYQSYSAWYLIQYTTIYHTTTHCSTRHIVQWTPPTLLQLLSPDHCSWVSERCKHLLHQPCTNTRWIEWRGGREGGREMEGGREGGREKREIVGKSWNFLAIFHRSYKC